MNHARSLFKTFYDYALKGGACTPFAPGRQSALAGASLMIPPTFVNINDQDSRSTCLLAFDRYLLQVRCRP